jgi:hypothetical protein
VFREGLESGIFRIQVSNAAEISECESLVFVWWKLVQQTGDQSATADWRTKQTKYSGTSVHERPCSRTIQFTNTQAGNSGKLRVSAPECQLLVN